MSRLFLTVVLEKIDWDPVEFYIMVVLYKNKFLGIICTCAVDILLIWALIFKMSIVIVLETPDMLIGHFIFPCNNNSVFISSLITNIATSSLHKLIYTFETSEDTAPSLNNNSIRLGVTWLYPCDKRIQQLYIFRFFPLSSIADISRSFLMVIYLMGST